MFRKSVVSLVTAVVLCLGLGSFAVAQDGPNPAAEAVFKFANLLDEAFVAQVIADNPDNVEEQVRLVLARLVERQIIRAEVASAMNQAVADKQLPRATFTIFIADVANGTTALTDEELANPAALEGDIMLYGILLPTGIVYMRDADVSEVTEDLILGGILTAVAQAYQQAITPLNQNQATGG